MDGRRGRVYAPGSGRQGRDQKLLSPRRLIPLAALAAAFVLPAGSSADTICVEPAGPAGCDLVYNAGQLQTALDDAGSASEDDLIVLGAKIYDGGPYSFTASGRDELIGAGREQTYLSMPVAASSDTALVANDAILRDFSVVIPTGSTNDRGIQASLTALLRVDIFGGATDNTRGITLSGGSYEDGVIALPIDVPDGTVGMHTGGTKATTVAGVSVSASTGIAHSGDAGHTLHLSRAKISAKTGISTDGGVVEADNALINLGSFDGARGVSAANPNASTTPMTIHARHLTIVGGGSNSLGVRAGAVANAQQQSTVTLADSVISGPEFALVATACNNAGGSQSTATVSTTYSNYNGLATVPGACPMFGDAQINEDHQTEFPPGFADPGAGDYSLAASSQLVDAGDPATGGPPADLESRNRVQDGNNDQVVRRDIGAYELPDLVAPLPQIAAGPSGLTNDNTPTFSITMSPNDPLAAFECSIDSGSFGPCSGGPLPPASSHTAAPLSDGPHQFQVRTRDNMGNFGGPVTRSFTVDTQSPPKPSFKSAPRALTRNARPVFRLGGESGAVLTCKLDGGAVPCPAGVFRPASRLADGNHTLGVTQVDAAGNAGPEATRSFRVDTKRPQTTIRSGPTGRTRDPTPTFRLASSESRSKFQCKVDGGRFKACPRRYTTPQLTPGPHVLKVRAVDAAGNRDRTPAIRRISFGP